MKKTYLIVKSNDGVLSRREIDEPTFWDLKTATDSLESFSDVSFLSNSYVKAKEAFFSYDFTQFNVREIDMFSMFLFALEAMASNRTLWEAFLKRNYAGDGEIFPSGTGKSCFGIKDSEFFDKSIYYVVSKVLRDRVSHYSKPYTEIVYRDSTCRQFIITKDDLLNDKSLNTAEKNAIRTCAKDYYDVVEVIRHAFSIIDELNKYMLNLMLQKEWDRYMSARLTIRHHIGVDWQGACLVYENPRYPQDHLLFLKQISISKQAMNSILSIAARNLGNV